MPILVPMRLLTLAFVLSCCTLLFGQALYEGQTVSSVELVSNPFLDTSDLQHLIEQKPHQPYSEQKVQATAKALERTGRFQSVRTDVTPEADGLRILFVLEPAYYYGLIDFSGATKVFTYSRLLQVVNLPDQDPFDPRGVSTARESLTNFLRHNGFFEARVDPQAEFDSAHGLAHLDFATDLGRQAKIGAVQVQGTSADESVRLLKVTQSWRAKFTGASLKSGQHYDTKRLDAASKLIKNDLAKRGYLASRVNLSLDQYHAETRRTDLTLQVDERKKIGITISGARLSWVPLLSSHEEHKLLPFYEENAFDQDLVEEGSRNLLNYFQGKGYFDVHVETNVQRQPQQIFLIYKIVKGKKYKVAQVSFRGNHNVDEDKLVQQVAVKKGRFLFSRGRYSRKLVTQSVDALEAYYQSLGYEDAKIDPQVVQKERTIDALFNISEGEQTRVAKVSVVGTQHLTAKDFSRERALLINPGGPFSPGGLSKDRSSILAAYLSHGYVTAQVKATVTRHPDDSHRVDVTFDITEGQQVKINQIVMAGAAHTKRSLIRRSANLWPEQPLSQTDLLKAESELYNDGIFDYVNVGPKRPITDQREEMVVLKLHEAKRNTITYGLGFEITRRGGNVPSGTVAIPGLPNVNLGNAKVLPSEDTFASPRGSIEFSRRNLRGLGETGTISLLAARLRQRALATYSIPHFRRSIWSSLLSLSAERTTENPLFTANLANVSLQFERPIDRDRTTIAQVRYSFGHTSLGHLIIPDLVLPEDQNVRLSTFSGTLIRDTRDKPLDAHRGFFQTADLGITAVPLGASATFARFLGQNAYYRPLPHHLVWANSVRLGLEKAFAGSRIPTSERFFSGGGTSLRGFPINGAGPQRNVAVCSNPNDPSTCSTITVPVGGNMLFVLNSEWRFPIPIMQNFGGVVFYDGGNVFDHINLHRFADGYSNTVGIGLRYNTPVGPVRFDVGRNLNPITGIRATQFFITLGQAF